jgi:hypothetical protein
MKSNAGCTKRVSRIRKKGIVEHLPSGERLSMRVQLPRAGSSDLDIFSLLSSDPDI